jgi:hypothetical protein
MIKSESKKHTSLQPSGFARWKKHESLDVSRRIKLRLSPKDTELPQPQDWWGRVQTFFFSQGLLASLGRGSRLVYLVALLLLTPSLVGVYAPQLSASLGRHAAHLDELCVMLTQEEARKSWEETTQSLGLKRSS